MTPAVAIVGMACQYPDARSPQELWENVLAQRRAFRRLPPERLNLADYLSTDRSAPNCTYAGEAALLKDYVFDRERFLVVGSTFRATDLVHWLALDVAAQALVDAGFPAGAGLGRDTTGVVVGNTLTGEMSRANVMRLRWPYVRRVLAEALQQQGWTPERRQMFLTDLEERYKAPFPPIGEESLAGGLANTIAGRICNHFDLKGGGYTVDGACASSLLAVTTACTALLVGDLDVALAGGVDISIDPFELVGFAKAGALATDEMRVYDAHAEGFWPGEGCGFVVLMRHDEALAQGRRIYAVLRGWGVSSDGSGGLTRPEVAGQRLAVQRAYQRAGFGIDTVTYFEGHGTGTSVGDATELQTLSQARRAAAPTALPAVIGSIKANIGHTKAAAGIAGLLKATLALHHQILPPTTGCAQPHPELTGTNPALQVLPQGMLWPSERALRAGVSAMGFGGINTHVVLEGVATTRRQTLKAEEQVLLASAQDAEVFLFQAPDAQALRDQVAHLLTIAPRLSRAELTDLAAHLATNLVGPSGVHAPTAPMRAALVATSPATLTQGLEQLQSWLAQGTTTRLEQRAGVYLGSGTTAPRLGFLFPGQGAPGHISGGLWRQRFARVQALYAQAALPSGAETVDTAVAQPAIVTASLAGLRVLGQLGVTASVAVGHSLGELTALHWAGVWDEAAVLRTATVRGQAMAALGSPTGAMASLAAGPQVVAALLDGAPVVVAGLNTPQQTVIAGEASALARVVARAQAQGVHAVRLPVSHAFHSPLVAAAVPAFAAHLERETLQPVQRAVVSTVTGARLAPDVDVSALLCQQVTAPVRFAEAVTVADAAVDLWLEVGPGAVLSGLLAGCTDSPVVALNAGAASLQGLLHGCAAAYVLGAALNPGALFAERYTRPFDLDWQPHFFVNPCELAPQLVTEERALGPRETAARAPDVPLPPAVALSALETVRGLVAARAELPLSAVHDNSRLLGDLHLNSITVSQIIVEAARSLGLPAPLTPTDYATATVAAAAQALAELAQTGDGLPEAPAVPAGVDAWIRPFTVALVERPLPRRQRPAAAGHWQVLGPPDHPLIAPLQQALAQASAGSGVVVCLPPEPDEGHLDLLLQGARAVAAELETAPHFILVQQQGGAAAFARTLHLEMPTVATCVVDLPFAHPQAPGWVLAEAMAVRGYTEAHYDAAGTRRVPVLRLVSMEETPTALPLGQPQARCVALPVPGSAGILPALEAGETPALPGKPPRFMANALGPQDVLLVTGGGKGIAAECALALAQDSGVRLALLGRSQPETDAELATNLARFSAAGLTWRYVAADVTNAAAVHAAVRDVEASLGPVTAVLHGAGANVPQLLSTLDSAALQRTLAPKVQGARHVLAAVDPSRLRLFLAFGSIIARTGMRGEADYALANEWLARLTAQVHAAHPTCRCLAIEWSVWSGVGMGERLGRIDALRREGVTPIAPAVGLALLRRLLTQPLSETAVIVTGRFGEAPTLQVERPDLPFWRFLEQPRVYYPGVELVVDVELSGDTDPYLDDHIYQGERLWPAVLGLEAMAQVAMALGETDSLPLFEDVAFQRPVVVRDRSTVTLRLAALRRESGAIDVVLRSSDTAFQVDHFRATCRWQAPTAWPAPAAPLPTMDIALDPQRDMYGTILFQRGRFQRLSAYRHVRALACQAVIEPDAAVTWFGPYLPATLVLGDPGARDATIHAIQACIPHATLLPIGIDRLVLGSSPVHGPILVCARERARHGDLFIYDIDVLDATGGLRERWEGLRLRQVGQRPLPDPWPVALLGPYCARRIAELLPEAVVSVVLTPGWTHDAAAPDHANLVPPQVGDVESRLLGTPGSSPAPAATLERGAPRITPQPRSVAALAERQRQTDQALQHALGACRPIWHRPDGKPTVLGEPACEVSAAHSAGLTLAVAGRGPLGCDLESVVARPAALWHDLLGAERATLAAVLAQETGEDQHQAATRMWSAAECLRKAGVMLGTPLTLLSTSADGWVVLGAGALRIATVATAVQGVEGQIVLAVLGAWAPDRQKEGL